MSVPVLETIARAIKTRIEGVTTTAGYNYTIGEVVRPNRNGENIQPRDLLCILRQMDPEPPTYLMGNPPRVEWRQPFAITIFAIQSDRSENAAEAYINTVMSDVMKAITTPASWWTWSSNAVNSEWGAITFGDPIEGLDSVLVELIVTYRTKETDPYTVAA